MNQINNPYRELGQTLLEPLKLESDLFVKFPYKIYGSYCPCCGKLQNWNLAYSFYTHKKICKQTECSAYPHYHFICIGCDERWLVRTKIQEKQWRKEHPIKWKTYIKPIIKTLIAATIGGAAGGYFW